MPITAFDAKEFERSKYVQIDAKTCRTNAFFSPLGVGVHIDDEKRFKQRYTEEVSKLAKSFQLPYVKFCYSSNELKRILGPRKAPAFCDNLIQAVSDSITKIFVTYVVRPPATYPTTEVGGRMCPRILLRTELFLRQLGQPFSYLTAWRYCGITQPQSTFHIDGIGSAKRTAAWDDLVPKSPRIFPHGDECNPYISCADILAFLTDVKLYTFKLTLHQDNVRAVWKDYSFQTDVHYMDVGTESKYCWYSEDLIDVENYLARPMLFFLFDELINELPPTVTGDEKLGNILLKMQPYQDLANFAFVQGGGYQRFDSMTDMQKVRDGDNLVYLGPKSKKMAKTLSDAYDIAVMSLKELRSKMKKT